MMMRARVISPFCIFSRPYLTAPK